MCHMMDSGFLAVSLCCCVMRRCLHSCLLGNVIGLRYSSTRMSLTTLLMEHSAYMVLEVPIAVVACSLAPLWNFPLAVVAFGLRSCGFPLVNVVMGLHSCCNLSGVVAAFSVYPPSFPAQVLGFHFVSGENNTGHFAYTVVETFPPAVVAVGLYGDGFIHCCCG